MNKKLPKIYANKSDIKTNNNQRVYYANKEVMINEKPLKKIEVIDKINNIFNSHRFVSRMNVIIETSNQGKLERTVIGKNFSSLITIDGELIPIDSIIDINIK